ncbi:MAG: hypothetical protein HYV28_05470 [Ignavibacteriales bacterium]|nr:hypothetical protein [Ignavibacteriales bacterium]
MKIPRHPLLPFLILFLTVMPVSVFPQTSLTGDLSAYVDSYISGLPGIATNAYQTPSATVLATWARAITDVVNGSYSTGLQKKRHPRITGGCLFTTRQQQEQNYSFNLLIRDMIQIQVRKASIYSKMLMPGRLCCRGHTAATTPILPNVTGQQQPATAV